MPFTRNQYPVLLDANALAGKKDAEDYDFARVDKSTQYELTWNGQTETKGYIDAANDTNELTGFQTAMGQEIILEPTNRMFRLIDEFAWKFKTGADTIVPCCLPRPYVLDDDGNVSDQYALCALWKEASVVPNSLNTVDGKYSFDINLNGDPTYGYMEKGTFKFIEGNPPEETIPAPDEGGEEATAFSLKSSKSSTK